MKKRITIWGAQLKVSIIIPTMNEEESIGKVIEDIHEAMRNTEYQYEILVVDTNSQDRTREIAAEKGAIVIDEPRRGYGRAYKTGFQMAKGDILVTLDADSSYPAEMIPRLVEMLCQENVEFITTNRFGKIEKNAMSFKHRVGNWILTVTTNILFGIRVRDSQSGMWVFRKDCLSRMNLISDGMPFSEEIKIEAFKKARAMELPIEYRKRIGKVKLSSWKDGWQNLSFLFKKRFSLH
ncbi:MAG: glycosyltransferase family 2 protein [Methanomassiliicoccales archaeon]|jgi:glycosyltransferase involved in cell wall biosynthesis|nr:glycosyltransferase family 2 protein [Methanomassiliicoccales archaeon]